MATLFFAITAGLAPPIAVATPLVTPDLASDLEEVGCAICVHWPVRPEQLDALRAVFLRRSAVARYHATFELLLDPLDHSARIGAAWLRLSPQEFGLLWCLSAHGGAPVSAEALLREAWHSVSERRPRQALEFCVSQLRRKLRRAGSRCSIETRRGFGYQLG